MENIWWFRYCFNQRAKWPQSCTFRKNKTSKTNIFVHRIKQCKFRFLQLFASGSLLFDEEQNPLFSPHKIHTRVSLLETHTRLSSHVHLVAYYPQGGKSIKENNVDRVASTFIEAPYGNFVLFLRENVTWSHSPARISSHMVRANEWRIAERMFGGSGVVVAL